MKRIAILTLFVLLMACPLQAQIYTESFPVMGGNPITAKLTVTDTSALLSTAFDAAYGGTDPTWSKVKAVLLTCETNDVRVSFGTAAGQGVSAMGHILAVGQSLRIPNGDTLRKTYIINKTALSAGVLMVTVER